MLRQSLKKLGGYHQHRRLVQTSSYEWEASLRKPKGYQCSGSINHRRYSYSYNTHDGEGASKWTWALAIPIFAVPVFAREDERTNTDDPKSESPTDHQNYSDGEHVHEAEIEVERVSPEVLKNIEKLKDEMLKEIASQAFQIFKEEQKKTREQRDLEDEMDKFEVKFGTIDTRFEHVIGNSELKTELMNILKFMKHPDKYFKMGASLPNGCIINGPHGSGKTLLARAMAGESNGDVLFYSTKAVDFSDHSSGVERLRGLFKLAHMKKPCIIFIDDIDCLPRECQELLCSLMDGFHSNHGVFLLAATTSSDIPESFARPGRFDLKSSLKEPDVSTRLEIISDYLRRKEIEYDSDVDLSSLASDCIGLTGAEIVSIINHAVISTANNDRTRLTAEDLNKARDKVLCGLTTPGQTAKGKLQTAYHEAGHAMVQYYSSVQTKTIHKLTIIPRGDYLGATHYVGDEDRLSKYTREEMVSDIDVALGGRVAEEVAYGEDKVSTGASSDLIRATKLSKQMVKYYGFSDVGLRAIEDSHTLSNELQKKVDDEMDKILREAYERVKRLLTSKRRELTLLAEKLVEKEELSAEQVREILEGFKSSPATGA